MAWPGELITHSAREAFLGLLARRPAVSAADAMSPNSPRICPYDIPSFRCEYRSCLLVPVSSNRAEPPAKAAVIVATNVTTATRRPAAHLHIGDLCASCPCESCPFSSLLSVASIRDRSVLTTRPSASTTTGRRRGSNLLAAAAALLRAPAPALIEAAPPRRDDTASNVATGTAGRRFYCSHRQPLTRCQTSRKDTPGASPNASLYPGSSRGDIVMATRRRRLATADRFSPAVTQAQVIILAVQHARPIQRRRDQQ